MPYMFLPAHCACVFLQEPMHEVIHFAETREDVHACVALQWCSDAYSDTLMGYVNSIRTTDGGSHVDGLRSAVARAVNSAARAQKLIRVSRGADKGVNVDEGVKANVSSG